MTNPVMNKRHQMIDRSASVPFYAVMLIVLSSMVFSLGCRQAVSNPQSAQSSPFSFSQSKIFGRSGNSSAGSRQQQSYLGNQPIPGPGQGDYQQQYAAVVNQVQQLNQRLGAYDNDNQLLNTEVASLKQKLQLASQFNQTLKSQLADTTSRIQRSEMEKNSALQQLAAAKSQFGQSGNATQTAQGFGQAGQTPNRLAGFSGGSVPAGGATIRANNSLMQKLSNIQIPGGQARMDGDVIRIEFPTDRMFVPGTYQIQPAQLPVLQNIAATIRQSFPKQIVGIEAHWDNTPLNPSSTTHHQLTATQSLAVFDNLVRLGLPKTQLFTMAMASNRPRHPQGMVAGISPNRRIELVIYPETYDGSY